MIDTHTHIYGPEFDADRPEVVERAIAAGVARMLLPSCDVASARQVADVCAQFHDACFPMYGLHPTEMGDDPIAEMEQIFDFAERHGPFIAVGEIGLDLHWDKSRKDVQVEVFLRQMKYAYERDLPVSIHCRDAVWLLLEVLPRLAGQVPRGSLHCFSGSIDEARLIVRRYPMLMFGFGGTTTYKNSRVAEVAATLPVDRILTETDAPYLTPVPHRGKRNEPAYVPLVVDRLAEALHADPSQIAEQTHKNALQLFFTHQR